MGRAFLGGHRVVGGLFAGVVVFGEDVEAVIFAKAGEEKGGCVGGSVVDACPILEDAGDFVGDHGIRIELIVDDAGGHHP